MQKPALLRATAFAPTPCPRPRSPALRWFPVPLAAALMLAGCGGGDAPVTTVSGSVVKGPVGGARVCAYAVTGNARGPALGDCVTTASTGNYTLPVPADTGALWLEATGGSYVDETTGISTLLAAASVLTALVSANGGDARAMLTPLTTLALNSARAGGTLDAATFAAAQAQWRTAFGLPAGLDLATTEPLFGNAANAYGVALAVVSRMVAQGLSLAQLLSASQVATLQAAIGSATAANASGTPAPAPSPAPAPAPSPAPAPAPSSFTVTNSSVAAYNGAYNVTGAQFESNSSNPELNSFADTASHCRVAAYGLRAPDGTPYYVEVSFSKADRSIGMVKYGLDNSNLQLLARQVGPLPMMSVDIASRRISFDGVVLASNNIMLSGTFLYPTNVVAANRAACG